MIILNCKTEKLEKKWDETFERSEKDYDRFRVF